MIPAYSEKREEDMLNDIVKQAKDLKSMLYDMDFSSIEQNIKSLCNRIITTDRMIKREREDYINSLLTQEETKIKN